VEVLIALGLLGTVLISLLSLFLAGGKLVRSGRNTSAALAISHEILEVIEQMPYEQTYGYFGGDASAAHLSVSTSTGGNAGRWQAAIARELGLQASGTIDITPLGSAVPLNLGNSQGLQVRVTITWTELGRARSVSLQEARF
jgi:hypothetical protein